VFHAERPTVRINYEDAVLISKRKIEEYGEDHCYTPESVGGPSGGCVYFTEAEGQTKPSCIVGHIINELVEDKDLLKKVFIDNAYNPINVARLKACGVIDVDSEETEQFLTTLQGEQDEGKPWSEALETAISNHPQLQEA
jgi:hypothetical protein